MGRINLLDDRIINRIAAGEVVENPASVVKELVENSIDAGATHVTIEFSKGGTEFIRIVDNGCGMDDVDAKTSFIRHATSKISSSDDLTHIATMGFRGEALASISEVSHVELTTSTGDVGTKISVKGGVCEYIKQVGFPRGTTIEVSNLFFNTPARKKFLKSLRAETSALLEICQKFILAHPEVSFKVINSGRTEISSSGDKTLLGTICAVYGENSRNELFEVCGECGDIKINGYTSKPAFAQLNRRKQAFFVNGRYVKSPLIASALDEAYKGSLMINKYPFAVLNINMRYEEVDVNVHPQKTEVRFSDSRAVFNAVIKTVSKVLLPDTVFPEMKFEENDDVPVNLKKAENVTVSISDTFDDNTDISASTQNTVDDGTELKVEPNDSFEKQNYGTDIKKHYETRINISDGEKAENIEVKKDTLKKDDSYGIFKSERFDKNRIEATYVPLEIEKNVTDDSKLKQSEPVRAVREEFSGFYGDKKIKPEQISVFDENREDTVRKIKSADFKTVGVLWDTYILCESGDMCYIIDQHAAHERMLYDKYSEEFKAKKVIVQQLLIPEVMEADPFDIDLISDNIDVFKSLGFEIDIFGNRSCIIRGVPSVACEVPFAAVFNEATELIRKNMSAENLVKDIVCTELMKSACKHAVKGKQKLSDSEIEYIINAVKKLKTYTCPHGRPIAVTLSRKETEKKFGRIQ